MKRITKLVVDARDDPGKHVTYKRKLPFRVCGMKTGLTVIDIRRVDGEYVEITLASKDGAVVERYYPLHSVLYWDCEGVDPK